MLNDYSPISKSDWGTSLISQKDFNRQPILEEIESWQNITWNPKNNQIYFQFYI